MLGKAKWVMALIPAALLAACNGTGVTELMQEFGLARREMPPAHLEILCDTSSGSSCNAPNLATTLDVLVPFAAARTGSTIRFWTMGPTVGETTLVAEHQVGGPKRSAAAWAIVSR